MTPATPDETKKAPPAKEGTPAAPDAARGGLSKLKDPNQAHETLEIAKNVPVP